MAKYGLYGRRSSTKPRPWDVHPVWRGIGCILIILIPIMAYAGAALLVQENLSKQWVAIPAEFARVVTLPIVGSVAYFYANLAVAAVLAAAGFVLLTILYSLVYSLLGPPRYGPLDAPQENRGPRRRR